MEVTSSHEKLAWRRTQPYAAVSTAIVNIFFGGEPYGATNRVRGVPTCVAGYTTRTEDDRPEYESLSAGESERE